MAYLFEKQIKHYPLLGNLNAQYSHIDLSTKSQVYENHLQDWEEYLTQLPSKEPDKIYYGGYLENRFFYSNEDLFGSKELRRDIHLGVDLWVPAKTAIFCPLDAIVHSVSYNDQELDYGHTVILQHKIDGLIFFTLYGHLNSNHVSTLKVNDKMKMGTKFCEVGPIDQNGGWPPHLHFQIIKDLGQFVGDYPGVCNIKELDYYRNNCPDGSDFIF